MFQLMAAVYSRTGGKREGGTGDFDNVRGPGYRERSENPRKTAMSRRPMPAGPFVTTVVGSMPKPLWMFVLDSISYWLVRPLMELSTN